MADDPPSFGVDLPDRFRSLLSADSERFATLYNGLQGMDPTAFEAAFGESLGTLRREAAVDGPQLVGVLGLAIEDGVAVDATLLSIYARDDGRVVHADDSSDVPDAAVYLPIRVEDFPPGSGESVAEVDLETYREVVASMLYLRYELCEDDEDRYDDLYRRPLARGLAAYVP